jgi:hypothetical protein
MITFFRTFDPELIKHIYSFDGLYEDMSDDTAPKLHELVPNMHPTLFYWIIIVVDLKIAGLMRLDYLSSTVVMGHFGIAAWARPQAVEIGLKGVELVRALGFKKIVGFTPATKEHVIAYIQRIGFKKVGILTKSHLEDGDLIDQVITEADL